MENVLSELFGRVSGSLEVRVLLPEVFPKS
jgi:hypothetical protein